MLFDSHFHLTDCRLCDRQDEIVGNFSKDNVLGGIEIGANYEELPAVFDFANKTENIYCTAGVHPLYADGYSENDFVNFIEKHINDKKFIAIGECGLDFHRPDVPDKELQKRVFISQILIANKYKKPLVVHSRDAGNDTIAILTAFRNKLKNGVLIHCMSYSAEFAKKMLGILPNIYFAFGGAITYKKNLDIMAETIKAVPSDRILIETDAPYLSPESKRSVLNEPKFMSYTVKRIADILNLTVTEAEKLTVQNTYKLFNLQ
jgi:TatD DNase family protein